MPGLFKKFNVSRADGKPERENAAYFVLDVANDPHAREAFYAYAESLQRNGTQAERIANQELAQDMFSAYFNSKWDALRHFR